VNDAARCRMFLFCKGKTARNCVTLNEQDNMAGRGALDGAHQLLMLGRMHSSENAPRLHFQKFADCTILTRSPKRGAPPDIQRPSQARVDKICWAILIAKTHRHFGI